MNIKLLSNTFDVRRLSIEDTDLIYNLSYKNKIFYQFHPPFVTRESIQEDIRALPDGKDYNDKYYIGKGIDVAIEELAAFHEAKEIVEKV